MPNYWWNQVVHQSSKVIVEPAIEPITLAQAKVQCRIDDDITSEDDLITDMIVAARRHCEKYSKRAFITQTIQHNLDAFPFWRNWSLIGPPIQMLKPPVQSVVSLQYYDESGTLQTFDPTLYTFDGFSQPGRIVRNEIQPWPIVAFVPNAVQITAIHGYGDDPTDVPATIRKAILLHLAWQYRNRGDQEGTTAPPQAIYDLLDNESYGGVW